MLLQARLHRVSVLAKKRRDLWVSGLGNRLQPVRQRTHTALDRAAAVEELMDGPHVGPGVMLYGRALRPGGP